MFPPHASAMVRLPTYARRVSDSLELSIETERLSLHPVRSDDAEDLFAILRDPVLGELTGDPPPESVAAVRARIERWTLGPGSDDERWLNWLARMDGRAVAHLQATVKGSTAWLAWVVAVEVQRRGYATEAARGIMDRLASSGVDGFAATILEGHEASEGVARRLGLVLTDEIVDGERVWRRRA
jgi:RimJ/RimL family protein N-acetyltransferase